MRRLILAALLVVPCAAHAQVPVTDAMSIAQEIKSYVMQGQQALTSARQLAQQVQEYYSFVQNPSLGAAAGLMNQTGMSNDLPINPNALVGLTSGYSMSLSGIAGRLGTLSNLANTAYTQNHVYDCTNQSWACQQQNQRAYGLAGASGIAQSAYQDIRNHMPIVAALQQRAATATTPAERENVLVALASEQSWHDNMMAQVQAAEMQARIDREYLVQRDDERINDAIDKTIASIP